MGQVLHRGLLQSPEPVGVAGLWGQTLASTISWQRLGSLPKVTEGGLMRRFCVGGSEERMWKEQSGNIYRILMGRPEVKRPLGRPRWNGF